MQKSFRTLFVLLGVLFLYNSAHSATKEWGILRVGVFLPLSGSQSSYGIAIKNGMELALLDIKQFNPKVFGRMKITFFDTKSKTSALHDSLSDSKITSSLDIVLGGVRNYDGKKLAKATSEKGLPTVLIGSDSQKITSSFQHVFMNNFNTQSIARNWVAKIKELVDVTNTRKSSNSTKILVNDSNSRKLAKEIISLSTNMKTKFQIVDLENPSENKSSLVRSSQILVLARNLSSVTLRRVISSAPNTPILLSEFAFHNPLEIQGLHKNLIVGVSYHQKQARPELSSFHNRYQKLFDQKPSWLSALSYQSIKYIQKAFEKSKSNRRRPLKLALKSLEFESLGLKIQASSGFNSFEYNWWKR